MEKLESLASVGRLSDRVVRVLGQNPGKFTLQGTNTYLIGTKNPFVLVDTGEGLPEYLPHLESALCAHATDPAQPHVSDIVLSHCHNDHVGGLPSVLALLTRLRGDASWAPPRLHKVPLPLGPAADKFTLPPLPPASYTPSSDGPLHALHDAQTLTAPGTNLDVLHTPGHTADSLCLYVREDAALYTADTVLGQGTAVFENLGAYLSSLRAMLAFGAQAGSYYSTLYPGHGPVVADGAKLIETYIEHRQQREDQIIGVLRSSRPEGGAWTLWGIVATIYAAYPQNLWEPAAHGVQLHLRKLQEEGRVRSLGGELKDAQWELVESRL